MGDLSATEKRRILRERRQKKLASGANNRLDQITGMNGPYGDKTEAPTTGTEKSTKTAAKSTKASVKTGKTATKPATKESVPSVEVDDAASSEDPPVSTPDQSDQPVDLSHLKVADPLHKSPSEEELSSEEEFNVDKMLQNLLGGGPGASGANGTAPPMDDFMKNMADMFAQMQGGKQPQLPEGLQKAAAAFGGVPGEGDAGKTADAQTEEYNKWRLTRLQVWSTLFRYIGVFILMIATMYDQEDCQASFQNLRPYAQDSERSWVSRLQFWSNGDLILRDASDCHFWSMFLALELGASVIYYYLRSRIPQPPPNMLLSLAGGFIPQPLKPTFDAAIKNQDLIRFFFADVALVVVTMGAITYFSS